MNGNTSKMLPRPTTELNSISISSKNHVIRPIVSRDNLVMKSKSLVGNVVQRKHPEFSMNSFESRERS